MNNGYHVNDALNRKLYDAVFAAQIAHELGQSRRAVLRGRARTAQGALKRTLEKMLGLDDEKLDAVFEDVCRSYGV